MSRHANYDKIDHMDFDLTSPFKPTGDQPEAIASLVTGIDQGFKDQVLLGVTGSGKTFTMANVIAKLQKPALVISHNKTLAAQLYQEFRDFFLKNAVSYFVSYYDYYQPEAYIPQTDTYIEKETQINEEIDKLRLASTTNILTRKDTIVIASVSCIYNIGSPREYGHFALELSTGVKISRESVIKRLVDLQYNKSDYDFKRGSFRLLGDTVDVFPAYEDFSSRIIFDNEKVTKLLKIDPLNGNIIEKLEYLTVFPAKHYMTGKSKNTKVFTEIKKDLHDQIKYFKKQNKLIEAHRLSQKVNYDLEMIQEFGYVNGIENYSRYFDGRKKGEPPYTLLDYFSQAYKKDWLLFIDESHMTIPQIRGMYLADKSRKQTLIDFGFRLPAAIDNRPLKFDEFFKKIPQTIYVSATPDEWEISKAHECALKLKSKNLDQKTKDYLELRTKNNEQHKQKVLSSQSLVHSGIVEQLIRPTGILDPEIIIRPTNGQIGNLAGEIIKRKNKGERVLVTTITKRIAEDLAAYLNEKKYLSGTVHYLHSDIETLERSDILDDLRTGRFDVIVGINLLREGLDLPEVSLVAILDADKEGFLRSKISLIQTMGRAARHLEGAIIMYADTVTASMKAAIEEVERRRLVQLAYNRKHNIIPEKIVKPVRGKLIEHEKKKNELLSLLDTGRRIEYRKLMDTDTNWMTPSDMKIYIKKVEKEMRIAANELNFELAIEIRDIITRIKKQ